MDGKRTTTERLEVEDEEARLKRIQSTLEKLNAPSSAPAPPAPTFHLPTERSKPHFVPPSELLSRVQAFLPELEASNAVLEQRFENDPSSVDIEHFEDGAEQYIEMNLGLGIFKQLGARQGSSEDESMSSSSSGSESDLEDESSDTDSDESFQPTEATTQPSKTKR